MQLSPWKMISSKFRRNARRKPSWNPEDIRSTNQPQILASSHDRQVGECYLGEAEEETLEAISPIMSEELEDIWQRIAQGDCPRPKVICYGCNQVGHMKNQCPNRAAWGKKATGGGFN
jgi:hypothetical protein